MFHIVQMWVKVWSKEKLYLQQRTLLQPELFDWKINTQTMPTATGRTEDQHGGTNHSSTEAGPEHKR